MTPAQQLDLIIVIVYLISIYIVLRQAIASVDQVTVIKFNEDALKDNLQQQNLNDILEISFKLEKNYPFDKQPQELLMTIKNKSSDWDIEIDWDRSLLLYDGRSRYIVCFPPDKRIQVSRPQAFGLVAPDSSLTATITTEDLLKFDKDENIFKPSGPLVDLDALKKATKDKKKGDKEWDRYVNFMNSSQSLSFLIRVVLCLRRDDVSDHYTIPCEFSIRKIPWVEFLPVFK